MYQRKILLLFCCCICFGLLLPVSPLWAEDVEDKDKAVTEMESITVTANKIEEDVQKVPQSITVLDEVFLEEKGITNVPDVIREIPNMYIRVEPAGTFVNFRGLNTSDYSNNNPVVIYIDGVPFINRYGYDASLVNVERVEVLRGPQGTLYGKDAIGGVINIVTKTPENKWHGKVGAEYGSNNFMQGMFNMNGSLIADTLYMGINGKYEQDDGWIDNIHPGLDSDYNQSEQQQFGGYLLFAPTDRLSARLTLYKDRHILRGVDGYALPGGTDMSEFNRDDAENVDIDVPADNDIDTFSQTLNLSYTFDAVTLTSITVHKKMDINAYGDADLQAGTSYDGLSIYDYSETEAYSQELRIASNNESGIRWIAGLYLESEDREAGPYGLESPSPDGAMLWNVELGSETTTYAAFGQVMVPMGDQFELTMGGRYQYLEKKRDRDVYDLPIGTTGPPSSSYSGDEDWEIFLPKAALSYKMSDNWQAYFSYSQGYMPGGFTDSAGDSYDPQITTNYELGIKGSLDRLRLAANFFYMDIEDIHASMSDGTFTYTYNIDSAYSIGVELDLAYQLTDTIELTGSLGLMEAKYDTDDSRSSINYDGNDIQNSPAYSATAGISYKHPNGLYGRFGVKAVDESSLDVEGTNKADAYVVCDAKIGYLTAGGWDFYVYGKNLTDEEYMTNFYSFYRYARADYGDPLTVGVGLRYHF